MTSDMDAEEIKLALRGKALRNYDRDTLKEVVRTAVTKAYGLKGLALPLEGELALMVDEISGKISRSYSFITSQELFIIVEAGVTGEVGRDSRVSCASFFGWIAGYVASDIRKDVIRGYRTATRPSPYDVDTINEMNRQAEVRGINGLWGEYKDNGMLLDGHLDGYCAMVYDALVSRGRVAVGQNVIEEARRRAKSELRRMGSTRTLKDGSLDMKVKKHLLLLCFDYFRRNGKELSITN